jgi:hypothetical protein
LLSNRPFKQGQREADELLKANAVTIALIRVFISENPLLQYICGVGRGSQP